MQQEVAVVPLSEDPGAVRFRADPGRPGGGWAIVSGGRAWLWAEGLRPLQAAHPDHPFTYEAWVADQAGNTSSLGALGPAAGGIAWATYPLPDPGTTPAALLLTAQARGSVRPAAVVLVGRVATVPIQGAAAPQPDAPLAPPPDAPPQEGALPADDCSGMPAAEPAWSGAEDRTVESAEDHTESAGATAGAATLDGPAPEDVPAAIHAGEATGPWRPLAGGASGGDTILTPAPESAAACPPGYRPVERATIPLIPDGRLHTRAQGTATLDFAHDGIMVTLRGLPSPESLGESPHTGRQLNAYRVWLQVAGTRRVQNVGVVSRVWTDTWRVQVREGANLRRFDTVVVTAEDRAGSPTLPTGPLLLSCRYSWYEPL